MKSLLIIILALFLVSPFTYAEQPQLSQEVINSLHEKALQLKNDGKYQEAEILLKQIINIQPDNPNAHFDLGNVHLYQKRYDEAINRYKEAIRLGLDKKFIADYYFNLSICYAGMGNSERAIASVEQCLKINPDYESAKDLLDLYKSGGNMVKIEPVD